MNLGAIVKERREACGLTQRDLAKRTQGKVTQAKIARLELGQDNVTLETLHGLALAFDCAPVDLLPDEYKRKPLRNHAD
jgi:transcriptional regulator with XRE-family HTH domain